MAIQYFRVKNFQRFQHYRDRRPPWIKLYASLLSDMEFNALTEIQQLHLIKIWILASQNKNILVYDSRTIRRQLALRSRLSLEVFVKAGFLELIELSDLDASKMLQPSPTSTEGYKEENHIYGLDASKSGQASIGESDRPSALFRQFWDIWKNRVHKVDSMKWFLANPMSEEGFALVCKAAKNYIGQVEHDRLNGFARIWQSPIKFLNDWESWMDHKVEILPGQKVVRIEKPIVDKRAEIQERFIFIKSEISEGTHLNAWQFHTLFLCDEKIKFLDDAQIKWAKEYYSERCGIEDENN